MRTLLLLSLFIFSSTVKLFGQGVPQWEWAERMGGSDPQSQVYNNATKVVTDSSGNSYVTGYFHGTATWGSTTFTASAASPHAFLAKYSPNGNVLWARQVPGEPATFFANNWSEGLDVAVDASGNVYLVGLFYGTVILGTDTVAAGTGSDPMLPPRQAFVIKYDPNGEIL